jgi:hypothetical protein
MRQYTFAAAILAMFAAIPAHAQLQTIKKLPPSGVTPVSVDKLPAPTKVGEVRPIIDETRPVGLGTAALPDLVIREIRQEGPRNFGIRVANQGAQRAAAFNILLTVLTTKVSENYNSVVETPALDAGREVWVTVETSPLSLPPTKMVGVADPAYVTAEIGLGNSIKWVTVKSRVAESDEKNNTLSVDVPPAG